MDKATLVNFDTCEEYILLSQAIILQLSFL